MDKDVLIQKYLKGKLTPTEESQFQKYMEEDPSFAASVPFLEEVHYAFAKADYDTTKAQLENFHKEVRRKNWRSWSVAATVLVLIGLGSLFFLTTESSGEALYAAHFEPYKNVVQPVLRSTANETEREKAFRAYDEGAYDEAVKSFDKVLKINPDPILEFYKANALLKEERYEEAITIFQKGLGAADSLTDERQWYLGLAYLKLGKVDLAKGFFKILTITAWGFKAEEAQLILDQLE